MVTKEGNCSIEAYQELSKKWALKIISHMFLGKKRFNDFIVSFDGDLSNKVLSDQLKRLEHFGFIYKEVVSTTPLVAEYHLTEMGKDLNRIVYEQLMFAEKYGLVNRNNPIFEGRSFEDIFNIE